MNVLSSAIAALPAFMALTGLSAFAQQPLLITDDAEIIKPGSIRFEVGFDYQKDKNFPLSGLDGDLTRLGILNLTFGIASSVAIETGGVIQNYLSINHQYQPSAVPLRLSGVNNSTNDMGDFYLATKVKLRSETESWPALGLRFGVELPTSRQARGIGVNQTNFFAAGIAGKHFGRVHVFGDLGLGILDAPVDPDRQNDVLLFGFAAAYQCNDRLAFVGEVNGRHSTRGNPPLGTESDGAARIGARFRAAGLLWDASVLKGVYHDSASSGFGFGVSYEANVFRPL